LVWKREEIWEGSLEECNLLRTGGGDFFWLLHYYHEDKSGFGDFTQGEKDGFVLELYVQLQ
jgi:hypothetical protein